MIATWGKSRMNKGKGRGNEWKDDRKPDYVGLCRLPQDLRFLLNIKWRAIGQRSNRVSYRFRKLIKPVAQMAKNLPAMQETRV